MAGIFQATHDTTAAHAATGAPEHGAAPETGGPRAKRPVPAAARPDRLATDDEILGIDSAVPAEARTQGSGLASDTGREIPRSARDDNAKDASGDESHDVAGEPENLRAIFDANPELHRAWQEAGEYRETFATPEEARAATALLADLDRMDALFFSHRPEDHAELARAVASLDPAAFASLAQAMNGLATETQRHRGNETGQQGNTDARRQGSTEAGNNGGSSASGAANATGAVGARHAAPSSHERSPAAPAPAVIPRSEATRNPSSTAHDSEHAHGREIPRSARDDNARDVSGVTPAQAEFFHAANAAAVQGVLDAIESQVERLLPEGVSRSARNRVVGEIYRELDASLRSNRQLAQQMREAFRSGALDGDHQRAIVSLVTGRARQALPGVAKRVLNEWTSTIVAAGQDRRARQRAAERRVDIAGSSGAANDGRRSMTPHDIDYARMSDGDILNL